MSEQNEGLSQQEQSNVEKIAQQGAPDRGAAQRRSDSLSAMADLDKKSVPPATPESQKAAQQIIKELADSENAPNN